MTAMDVILGLLHKRPFTGYEIKHTFQTLFSFFFDASYGTIYPTLSKMEELGYITKESVAQDSRPVKNVYSLTDKGREQFRQYLGSDLEKGSYRSDFMVRLYFGSEAEPAHPRRWVERELAEDREKLRGLTDMKAEFGERMSPTQRLCIQLGIEQTQTRIRVLEEGLRSLEASS